MQALQEQIRAAAGPLRIRGGGSKDSYGQELIGEVLDVSANKGIVSYEPGELVMTAKCGTTLAEIESLLDLHGQMLGFEPPDFYGASTLGGTLACGFSGPRRAYAGSARDFTLGTEIIDGRGQYLKFGGQVIKNVAGYDASRLMVGALGTLGVLVQASFKVLPKPKSEITLQFEMDEAVAIRRMNDWARQALPLSATAWLSGQLLVRLSGAETAVHAAHAKLGGEIHLHGNEFWRNIRNHCAAFFSTDSPLWRISLPSATPPLDLPGKQLITWGGAERWLKSDIDAAGIRVKATVHGGHATLSSGGDKKSGVFHPLSASLMKYHLRLKQQFDPRCILNRGRMYPDF